MADYRIRERVARILGECVRSVINEDMVTRHANFELAVCYRLGFGTSRNLEKAHEHLAQSKRPLEHLQNEIDRIRNRPDLMRRTKLAEAALEGYIGGLSFAAYGRDLSQLQKCRSSMGKKLLMYRQS